MKPLLPYRSSLWGPFNRCLRNPRVVLLISSAITDGIVVQMLGGWWVSFLCAGPAALMGLVLPVLIPPLAFAFTCCTWSSSCLWKLVFNRNSKLCWWFHADIPSSFAMTVRTESWDAWDQEWLEVHCLPSESGIPGCSVPARQHQPPLTSSSCDLAGKLYPSVPCTGIVEK